MLVIHGEQHFFSGCNYLTSDDYLIFQKEFPAVLCRGALVILCICILVQILKTIEEREKVQYITSIERMGIAEGMAKGRVEGGSRLLGRQLERRFGALPQWATEKLSSASEQALEAWGEAILTAPTLEAVFYKTKLT